MALHIALLEPLPPETTGAIASKCAAADASMHVVGPLPYAEDDAALRKAGPKSWEALDWWVHPGWRAFRDAMSRDRCLYFSVDGERDPADAPFKPNSVLVIGNAEGELPPPIRAKYGDRIYQLPKAPRKRSVDLPGSVEVLLALAAERAAAPKVKSGAVEIKPAAPVRFGRR
jgi:tRNA (cytidine/uridine-2'-O-)-methyltransferase